MLQKKKEGNGESHFGSCSVSSQTCCARPPLVATTEERGENVSIGMAQKLQRPERPAIVTVRRCSASSCRGMSRLTRTCSVWRRTQALDQAPAQVHHHQCPRLQSLHLRLHWHHRPRPLTDLPPDAFST